MKTIYRLPVAALLAFGVLAFPLFSQSSFAQSGDLGPLMDRMERMERDIRTINTRLARGERPATDASPSASTASPPITGDKTMTGPAVARISQRLADMEDEIRSSTGRMEDLGFSVDQLSLRLEKLAGDVEFRLNVLERRGGAPEGAPKVSAAPSPPSVQKVAPGGGFAPLPQALGKISEADLRAGAAGGAAVQSSVASARPAPSPPPVTKKDAELAAYANILPKGSAKDRYNYAIGLLRKTNYQGAEKALRAFIAIHGKNPLAKNARYWLGETFYVRGEFEQAAQIFLAAYQAGPKGAKAPDSLLKLGMSLSGLDKKREACAAFGKLRKDYHDLPPAVENILVRQLKRNACK